MRIRFPCNVTEQVLQSEEKKYVFCIKYLWHQINNNNNTIFDKLFLMQNAKINT